MKRWLPKYGYSWIAITGITLVAVEAIYLYWTH